MKLGHDRSASKGLCRQLHFRDLLAGHDCLDEAGGRYARLSPSRQCGPSIGRFPMCYGPEFVAHAVREWLGRLGVTTLYIEPGSPWENGYIERLASPPFGSMPACAMSCSTARSSTVWRRSAASRAGGASITTDGARTAASATALQPRKRSRCQPGRSAPLRSASRPGWHQKSGSANYAIGPIIAGSPRYGAISDHSSSETSDG